MLLKLHHIFAGSQMQGSGRTILLVEQNARTGLNLANNGVVLENGRVRLEGSHTDILNNPEIGHLCLGGTLSNTHTHSETSLS